MARDKKTEDRKPLCPICNHRHWSYEPHVFKKTRKKKK